jgi:hypothetical protein
MIIRSNRHVGPANRDGRAGTPRCRILWEQQSAAAVHTQLVCAMRERASRCPRSGRAALCPAQALASGSIAASSIATVLPVS